MTIAFMGIAPFKLTTVKNRLLCQGRKTIHDSWRTASLEVEGETDGNYSGGQKSLPIRAYLEIGIAIGIGIEPSIVDTDTDFDAGQFLRRAKHV